MNTLLIGLLAFIALAAVWFMGVYNSFVRLKALVDEAWSGIDVQLKRRYDLIPNLVATVKGYSSHEREVFENVTKMRSAAMNATTIEAKSQAEAGLTGALKTLFAVAENYPELKANQNFLSLQQELSSIETELQLARRYYNGAARNYNVGVSTFPATLVAKATGFEKASYFEVSHETERNAPTVTF